MNIIQCFYCLYLKKTALAFTRYYGMTMKNLSAWGTHCFIARNYTFVTTSFLLKKNHNSEYNKEQRLCEKSNIFERNYRAGCKESFLLECYWDYTFTQLVSGGWVSRISLPEHEWTLLITAFKRIQISKAFLVNVSWGWYCSCKYLFPLNGSNSSINFISFS